VVELGHQQRSSFLGQRYFHGPLRSLGSQGRRILGPCSFRFEAPARSRLFAVRGLKLELGYTAEDFGFVRGALNGLPLAIGVDVVGAAVQPADAAFVARRCPIWSNETSPSRE
jgi:hypothetical protein